MLCADIKTEKDTHKKSQFAVTNDPICGTSPALSPTLALALLTQALANPDLLWSLAQ